MILSEVLSPSLSLYVIWNIRFNYIWFNNKIPPTLFYYALYLNKTPDTISY